MVKPIVSVTVEVVAPFGALAATEHAEHIRLAVEKEFAALLSMLGLPARPVVYIGRPPEDTPETNTIWPQLRVNDKPCGYPDDLPLLAYGYVFSVPLRLAGRNEIASRLLEPESAERLQEWLALTLVEAVKRQPGILLNEEVAAAYAAEIAGGSVSEDVLKTVLDQHISLADVSTVTQVVRESESERGLAEKLITALKPDTIEVCLPPDYLRSITIAGGDRGIFKTLTDGVFYETGVRFPRFRFVPAPDLKPNSFCFRINHLTTPARCGLAPDQSLINVLAAGLTHINAVPALNPANGNETSVVDTAHSKMPGDPMVWSPMGYLILSLAAELRDKAHCLVDVQYTEAQLNTLGMVFPKLTNAVRERFPVEDVTRLLRALASEGVSLLDLRSILGAVLEFDYILVDSRYISLDDRLPISSPRSAPLDRDLVAYVRMQMKRGISHSHNRSGGTLGVYLLAGEFEDRLYKEMGQSTAGDSYSSAGVLVAELRRQFGNTNPLGVYYPMLTTAEVRPFVRSMVAADFPRWPILAYSELTTDIKVSPMETINPK